jgi:hypothetical protein
MDIFYRIAADIVVVFHFAYLAFIGLGLIAIVVGSLRRWQWVKNFWFRLAHLLAIGIVVFEVWLGLTCPLTSLEKWLRTLAGQATYQGDFIATWVHETLYIQAPAWMFVAAYTLIGLLVAVTFLLIPPRNPFRSPSA